MRRRALHAAVATLLVALPLSACGGASTTPPKRAARVIAAPRYGPTTPVAQRDPNIYPPAVRLAFIRSCERGGSSPALCSCTFVALRQRYSASQFVALFRAAQGREPEPVKRAAKACANS